MPREVCEIKIVEDVNGDPVIKVAGWFVLENDKVTYELNMPDKAILFKRLLAEDIPLPGFVSVKDNPDIWFHSLEQYFGHSSYISARIVS
jgi:hypothetical protein